LHKFISPTFTWARLISRTYFVLEYVFQVLSHNCRFKTSVKKTLCKVHYPFIRSIEVPSKSNVSISVVSQRTWNDRTSKCSVCI